MAIIKAQDGTSDPIITRMVAEDKVCQNCLSTKTYMLKHQGTMVQEAQPPHDVHLALPVLYGCGNDLRL
jgi:hypothetical protein